MAVTADEVLVSVGADFSDYNRKTEQSTTAFEENVNGAAKAAEDSVARVVAAFDREAQASAAMAAKASAAQDAIAAAQLRRDNAQSAFVLRAQRATQAWIEQQDRQAKAAEDAAQRITAAAARAQRGGGLMGAGLSGPGGIGTALPGGQLGAGLLSGTALGGGSMGMGGGFFNGNRGNLGGAGGIQNISYQLQDFIVQVSSGQSALRAFSQQAPQLLSGFGQWGAVLGIAAAGVAVLATALGVDFATAADRAKAAQASFDLAIKSTHGSFTQQEEDTAKAAAGLSILEQGYLRLAQDNIRQAIEANNKVIADSVKAAQDAGEEIQSVINTATTPVFDDAGIRRDMLLRQFAPLQAALDPIKEKLKDTFNLSPDDFADINRQLVGLRDQAKALGVDLNPIIQNVNALGNAVALQTQKNKELADVQTRVNESQGFWVKILQQLGFSIPEATGHVGGFISTLDEYISRLLKIQSIGGGQADVGVAATRGTTLNEQNKALGILDGTAAGNKRLTAVNSADTAATKAFNEAQSNTNSILGKGRDLVLGFIDARTAQINQTKIDTLTEQGNEDAKKKTTSASEKQQKAQDTALQKLDDEIKLNQRLIEVYKQGEVARIQAQAAYDAEKNALARGYAVGSDAYKQAVAEYQQKAEAKRLGDQQLKDLATGDQLTRSVATSQEAYNTTLAGYVSQLAKGTISAETYARLLRELNTQNNGYAEGIAAIGQVFNEGIQGATSFGDALLKVALQLAQLIAQAALLGTGPLSKGFDSLFGTLGGIFNLAGSILSPVSGNGTGPALGAAGAALALVPRATGGQVSAGKPYMVGEHGPEPFVPSVPGTIIPNHMLNGSGGGSQDVNLTQYINATGDRQIAAAAATAGKLAVEQALNNASKRVRSDGRRFGKG